MANFILPKGIVVNSPEIGGKVERINAEPLDLADIAKFWKVYTTTQRRLLDPTAERLENYWWRIWGSRRRELRGATVARLFSQISEGQSFVPLRGPPNRDEGTSPLNRQAQLAAASSSSALHRSGKGRPSTTSSSTTPKTSTPMPHPILKKTRGPSTTGPRPTARFISPHESEDETDPTSSSLSTNSHVVIQPPSPDSVDPSIDKKVPSSGSKKKGVFVASTKKKRPVMVRRQSAQASSAESAARSFEAAQQSAAAIQSSSEKTPPTFSDQPRSKKTSNFQENFSPSSERSDTNMKSSKRKTPSTAGELKRTSPRKTAPPQTSSSKPSVDDVGLVASSGDPGPSTTLRQQEITPGQDSSLALAEIEELELQEELEVQRRLLEEANTRANRRQPSENPRISHHAPSGKIQHSSLRPTSDGRQDLEGTGATRILPHEAKSTISLAPALSTVTGQLNSAGDSDDGLPSKSSASSSVRLGKGKERGEEEQGSDMFAKRPVEPVQLAASPDPNGPLSRSKSQLTLLLERDRARNGEKKGTKEKGVGRKAPSKDST